MTENSNHLLLRNFVCWLSGQGWAGRFFCWSLPVGSAMCQKLSGNLVESAGQYSLPYRPWLVWVVSETHLSMWSHVPKEASLGFLSQSSKRVSRKLKDLFNHRLISCTTSLLLCLLGKVIHMAKPRFKGSSWWEEQQGQIAKGRAGMGGILATVFVPSTLRVLESTSKKVRSGGRGWEGD